MRKKPAYISIAHHIRHYREALQLARQGKGKLDYHDRALRRYAHGINRLCHEMYIPYSGEGRIFRQRLILCFFRMWLLSFINAPPELRKGKRKILVHPDAQEQIKESEKELSQLVKSRNPEFQVLFKERFGKI